jgi:hypothetical protein
MPIWSESVFPEEAPTIQDLHHRLSAFEVTTERDTPFTEFVLFLSVTILASARAIPDHRIRCVTPAPRDSTIVLAFIPTGGDLSHPDEISSTVGDASVGCPYGLPRGCAKCEKPL